MPSRDYVWEPLETRIFKLKRPAVEFFCPLCRTKRQLVHRYRLTWVNYVQISMLTVVTTLALSPLMEWKGVFSIFVFWAIFEYAKRSLYRKEIPCPHCGFDASWYQRDVKVARQKVKEFWEGQQKPGLDSTDAEQAPPPESN